MTNYRPNSLLTTFTKIVEKLMLNRVSSDLPVNNLWVPEQFRFRNGISI